VWTRCADSALLSYSINSRPAEVSAENDVKIAFKPDANILRRAAPSAQIITRRSPPGEVAQDLITEQQILKSRTAKHVACSVPHKGKWMLTVWDTSDVARRDSFAYWRESVTQAYLPLEPETQSRADFQGRIVRNGCSRLKVSRVWSSRSIVARTASCIARRSNGDFFANLLLSGSGVVRQGDRTALAKAGDVIVVDTNQTFALEFSEGVDLVCVAFDGSAVRRTTARTGNPADLVVCCKAAGRLVAAYISGLAAEIETVGSIADLAADQFPALVARAAAPLAPVSTHLASLATRICQFVEAEIGDRDLGAKRIAAALGVSRSAVYEAMAAQGLTVAGFIRDCRLRGCIAEFGSANFNDLPTAAVAERWGFRDAAAFSRTFKRITGTPPGEFRRRLASG
jgi:AraC-like DNA-binding protein